MIDTSKSPKVHSLHMGSPLVFMDLDKCVMTYIHYYKIIQSIFTAPNICAQAIHLFIPLAATAVVLPGKSHGWRSLEGCSPWGR